MKKLFTINLDYSNHLYHSNQIVILYYSLKISKHQKQKQQKQQQQQQNYNTDIPLIDIFEYRIPREC